MLRTARHTEPQQPQTLRKRPSRILLLVDMTDASSRRNNSRTRSSPVRSYRVRPGARVPFPDTQVGHGLLEILFEIVGAANDAAREARRLDVLQCHGAVVGDDDCVVNRLARVWHPVGVGVNPLPRVFCGRQCGGRRRDRERRETRTTSHTTANAGSEHEGMTSATYEMSAALASVPTGTIESSATHRSQSPVEP